MQFLNNSVLQFLITTSISLLGVIVIIFIAFITLRKDHPRPQIMSKIVSSTRVLWVRKAKTVEEVEKEVQVHFKNILVDDDLYMILLKLWNSGESIESKDYTDPIKIDFGKNTIILDAEVSETYPPTIKAKIEACLKKSSDAIVLENPQLPSHALFTLKVFLTNFNREPEVTALIGGEARPIKAWEKTLVGRLLRSDWIRFGVQFLIGIFSLSLSWSLIGTTIVELNLQDYVLKIYPLTVFVFVMAMLGLPGLIYIFILSLIDKFIPDLLREIETKDSMTIKDELRNRRPY